MSRPKRTVGLPGHLNGFDVHLPAGKKKKIQHSEAAAELDSSGPPEMISTEVTENAPAVVPAPDINVGQSSAYESAAAEESGPDSSVPLEDPEQEVPDMAPAEVHYTVIQGGTKRGAPLLVDSAGYSYNHLRTGPSCTFWRCSRRGKVDKRCFATVQQRGEFYTRGPADHNHHFTPEIKTKVCTS